MSILGRLKDFIQSAKEIQQVKRSAERIFYERVEQAKEDIAGILPFPRMTSRQNA